MLPRTALPKDHRAQYSRLRLLLKEPGLIRGNLVEMRRACGKKSCRCRTEPEARHRSLYLGLSLNGKHRTRLHTGRVGGSGQGVGRALLGGPTAARADLARVSRAAGEAGEVALLRRFAAYLEKTLRPARAGRGAARWSAPAPDPDPRHLALGLRDVRAAPAQLQRPRAGASSLQALGGVGRGSQAERRHHRPRLREHVGRRDSPDSLGRPARARGAARPFTRGQASRIGWWRWMATRSAPRVPAAALSAWCGRSREPPEPCSSTTTASWSRSGSASRPPPSWTSSSSVPGKEKSPRHDGSSSASCASTPG